MQENATRAPAQSARSPIITVLTAAPTPIAAPTPPSARLKLWDSSMRSATQTGMRTPITAAEIDALQRVRASAHAPISDAQFDAPS